MCLYPVTRYVKRKNSGKYELVTHSCGKCLECITTHSTEWAYRLYLESKCHEKNCFVTLTYNNDNLPKNGNLERKDIQLFLKKLRKFISPTKIRIFYCGEYGSKKSRPHFHLIIFGWSPDDLVLFFVSKAGNKTYTSFLIEKIWGKGYISVEDITIDSAKYCAKYMQELVSYPNYLTKPFIGMSNRPGIGYYAIDLKMLDSDRVYCQGKSIQIPRYFLKVLERAGFDFTDLHNNRIARAELYGDNLEKRRKQAQEFLKKNGINL